MRINILLLEDNLHQRKAIEKAVLELGKDVKLFSIDNVGDAYKAANENIIDCFIIDIVLNSQKKGDMSGVDFVISLREQDKYYTTPIIFTTALYDEHNMAYKDLHCIEYIEKPIDYVKFKELMLKIINSIVYRHRGTKLSFRNDGVISVFDIMDIVYIESLNHTLVIHTVDGSEHIVDYESLENVMIKDKSNKMIQCKRCYLCNRDYIRNIDKVNKYITLKKLNINLEIGDSYIRSVVRILEYGY